MTLRMLLSLIIFSATLGGLVWATLTARQASTDEPVTVYALSGDQEVVYAIPPGQDELRIDSMLSVPLEDGASPLFESSYQLIFRWMDPSGAVIAERRVEERGFISWMVTSRSQRALYGHLPGSSDWLTDGRLTTVPVGAFLPEGGQITIQASSPYPVLLRAFLPTEEEDSQLLYHLIAPPQRRVDQLERKHDLPDWSTLERAERRGLLQTLWFQQSPVSTTATLQRALVLGERFPPSARRVRRQRLLSGRAMSINLIGPIRMLVSGTQDIADLSVSQITDVPEDQEQPEATVSSSVPLGLFGAQHAFAVDALEGYPLSVHIRNDADHAVDFYLSVDRPEPHQFFEHTPARSLASLLPEDDPLHARDAALVGPELHEQIHWLLTEGGVPAEFDLSGFQLRDLVRITARPLVDDPDETRSMSLQVSGFGEDGEPEWLITEDIPIDLSRYERVIGSDTWVSEPSRLYLSRRAARVSLYSDTPMLVRLDGESPPTGSWREQVVSEAQVRIRYERRAPTTWTAIQPTNTVALSEHDQVQRLVVNTRITLPDASMRASRSYVPVGPVGALQQRGRVWLFPESRPGSGYCQYVPGDSGSFELSGTDDRVVKAVLWSPDAGLDWSWGVSRDAVPWLEGVIRQRISRRSALMPEGPSQVVFSGPPGSTLWLGSTEGFRRCARPHTSRTYYPVGPGETVQFTVQKRHERQLISIHGLSTTMSPSAISVRFPELLSQPRAWRSLLDRDVLLQPQAKPARALMEPDARRWLTRPIGMLLREDVPNRTYTMHITNNSATRLLVRVSAEGARAASPEARWVLLQEAL